jgi:hypothetical protein
MALRQQKSCRQRFSASQIFLMHLTKLDRSVAGVFAHPSLLTMHGAHI